MFHEFWRDIFAQKWCEISFCFVYFGLQNGSKYTHKNGSGYGKRFDIGDIITVQLNIDKRELIFLNNGVSQGCSQGIAFGADVIPAGKEWRLGVCLYDADATVLSCGKNKMCSPGAVCGRSVCGYARSGVI